jgi:hypothetical protein
MGRSKEVDAWLAGYDNPMKKVVERIRAIILAADDRIEESIKWQAPTFSYRGNLASFFPRSKQHASLMFHRGAEIPGRHPRLEGTAEVGRTLKIGSVAEANAAEADIGRIVRAWCDWRDREASGSGAKAERKPTRRAQAPAKKGRKKGRKKRA